MCTRSYNTACSVQLLCLDMTGLVFFANQTFCTWCKFNKLVLSLRYKFNQQVFSPAHKCRLPEPWVHATWSCRGTQSSSSGKSVQDAGCCFHLDIWLLFYRTNFIFPGGMMRNAMHCFTPTIGGRANAIHCTSLGDFCKLYSALYISWLDWNANFNNFSWISTARCWNWPL